jgi:coenzyme F420-reducing hydrogenase alpha subunit
LEAIESALGIEVSEQTKLLRNLMMTSQIITSHGLHLFFFSSADFFGMESNLELIKKYPTETSWAMEVRDISNKVAEVIGGRRVHPLTPTVGGFRKLPTIEDLEKLRKACAETIDESENFANFFAKLSYPEFKRKTDYICLEDKGKYAVLGGKIKDLEVGDFLKKIKEVQLPESVAKRTYFEDVYMVGALPR